MRATTGLKAKGLGLRGLLIAFLLSLSLQPLALSPAFAGSPGSTGAEVLKFSAGPRAFGMGNAQTALVNDAFSLNLNPGGLGFVEYQEASFVYNSWVEGVTHQTLLYVHPDARWGTVGLGLTRFAVAGFQGYDASGHKAGGDVSQQDTVAAVGWGKSKGDVGAGLTAKFLQERLDTVTAVTYAVDLGVQAHTDVDETRLGAGLTAQNLGPGLKFDRDRTPLPTTYKAGLSASRLVFGDPCSITLDAGQASDSKHLQYALGAEIGVKGVVALRAGYQAPMDLGSGFSFGMGLKARNLRFDYAFLLLGQFGPTHRFGVTFRWGAPQEVSRDRDRITKAAWHRQRAREYMRDHRYLEAMAQYNAAIDLDPLDKETIKEMHKAYDSMPR